MANTRSAEKRHRQSVKRRLRNQAVNTRVKTAIKKVREAIAAKDPARAKTAFVEAERILHKAASKGVLHARNASRRVSRLAKQLAAFGK